MRFAWTTHKEQEITGNFRLESGLLKVEVVIETVSHTEERTVYRSYRPATDDDCEFVRLQSLRRKHLKESMQ